MIAMLTLSDRDAYSHAYRVAALSLSMGRVLGLEEPDLVRLEHAALLHDIGKLAMPEAIMRKPAPLTVEEQALVRTHPAIACELAAKVPYLADSRDIILATCTSGWMGSAIARRPRRQRSRSPPASSRWPRRPTPMTRARVFRDAIPPAAAVLELARCSGSFNPAPCWMPSAASSRRSEPGDSIRIPPASQDSLTSRWSSRSDRPVGLTATALDVCAWSPLGGARTGWRRRSRQPGSRGTASRTCHGCIGTSAFPHSMKKRFAAARRSSPLTARSCAARASTPGAPPTTSSSCASRRATTRSGGARSIGRSTRAGSTFCISAC